MIMFGVTSTTAASEPSATATAATYFPGFRDDAAFGAYGTHGCSRGCWRVHVGIGQNAEKTKTRKHENTSLVGLREYLSTSLGLTFAGVDALKPLVISVSIASTSTILIPSTARSATTDSA